MSHFTEGNTNVAEEIAFSWGRKERLGGKKLDRQYYGSFTYDGVEYFLYDSVYLWCEGQQEPHIGKLVEIYETHHLDKKVKVVWYFRPSEVQQWLRGTRALSNELFLGSGVGQGLFNINALETISGKCNVVCKSKDKRNPQASIEELKMSDFIFYRTFDVGNCILSERFPDKIAGVEVGHFFNQRKYMETGTPPKPKGNSKVAGISNSSSQFETYNDSAVAKEHFERDNFTNKKGFRYPAATVSRPACSSSSASDSYHLKKRKLQDLEVDEGKIIEADSLSIKPKKRSKLDSSEWFKKQPWEERMKKAQETGSLVLLENLDPSLTSIEVEDIVLYAFNKKASAKMIQCNAFSSPHNGQALVIFKSKDEADFAISMLKTRCLMIGDVRSVVGSRPSLKNPAHPSKYFGHITINNLKQMQQAGMRHAVSTSHYSQPNTIAFEMAMEWCALDMKFKLCWDALYQLQAKEIGNIKTHLKALLSEREFCS
ncbi:protein ANTI-SILENCING 1-like [Cynara cardunculus var. scolymus]|uniref:protein ANTI-SILENCING 1-like n=1 Tax=Cynara cardunculus var. scolymus TaxID=59895 RepID=UPI000D62390D|nr:protein ANTI-SILENCING 1-like [Cynara cardunculus var. scolymus]